MFVNVIIFEVGDRIYFYRIYFITLNLYPNIN
mgnify:CR=1 FL=1